MGLIAHTGRGEREQRELTRALVGYLAETGTHLDAPTLERAVQRSLPGHIGDTAMATIAETWFEEGRAQGHVRGRTEGRTEGRAEEHARHLAMERELLCRRAARRFGSAQTAWLAARLEGIDDTERLFDIAEWIVECESAAALAARMG